LVPTVLNGPYWAGGGFRVGKATIIHQTGVEGLNRKGHNHFHRAVRYKPNANVPDSTALPKKMSYYVHFSGKGVKTRAS